MKEFIRYIEFCGSGVEAARRLGVTEGAISHMKKGRYPVSRKLAILIEKDTEGAIKKEDLVFPKDD